MWFSQASYMKKKKKEFKEFRLYWGSSKEMFKTSSQNFVKSPLKFCLISQILFHNLWHVCIFPKFDHAVKRSNVKLGSSFEQTWIALSPQCSVTRFSFEAFLVLEKKIFKCFSPHMGMVAILFNDVERLQQKAQCEIW